MDFIPRDLVLPLLAIDLIVLCIVLLWPDDMYVPIKSPKREPPPEDEEEDEEPPPHDGMAAS